MVFRNPVLVSVTPQQPESHVPFSHSYSLKCLFSRLHVCWTAKRLQLETQSIPKSPLPDSLAPQLSITPTITSPPVQDASRHPVSRAQQLKLTRRRNGLSRADGTKRFTWKKFALGGTLLFGVMWLCRPRAHTFSWWGNGIADLEAEK